MALTRNQTLVHEALRNSEGPLTAYALLESLRDEGLKAPPQIYRALDSLVNKGLVHRLESLNSFVACRGHDCAHVAAFSICQTCGRVEEFSSGPVKNALMKAAKANGFTVTGSTIELRGDCRDCQAATA